MRAFVIVTLVFVLVAVFSAYSVFYAQGLPTTRASTQVDSTYVLRGSYNYVATLAPNTLYNTTILGKGDGAMFVSITRAINLTYTFALSSSKAGDALINSSYASILSGGAWNTTLSRFSNQTRMSNANSLVVSKSFFFNVTQIQSLIHGIDSELQYSSPRQTISVVPGVAGTLTVSGQTTSLRFQAPLNLTMSGGLISVNGTDYGQSGNMTSSESVSIPGNIQLQTDSQYFFFGSLVAVAASGAYTAVSGRRKPATGVEVLEVATRPYKEIIAASRNGPATEKQIVMDDWEDLVKVADTLGKPILEFNGKEPMPGSRRIFYVSEGDASYVYAFELKNARGREEPGAVSAKKQGESKTRRGARAAGGAAGVPEKKLESTAPPQSVEAPKPSRSSRRRPTPSEPQEKASEVSPPPKDRLEPKPEPDKAEAKPDDSSEGSPG